MQIGIVDASQQQEEIFGAPDTSADKDAADKPAENKDKPADKKQN